MNIYQIASFDFRTFFLACPFVIFVQVWNGNVFALFFVAAIDIAGVNSVVCT